MNRSLMVISIILGLAFLAWVLYGYFSIRGLEEPKYEVAKKADGYEIRKYEPYIIAETKVRGDYNDASNEGFRYVGGYIFGNNTKKSDIAMTAPVVQGEDKPSEEIAMTVPVVQEGDERDYTLYFVMPSKYTLENLPEPNNDRVKLREVPERTVAVLRFSGWVTEGRIERKKAELLAALERDGFEAASEPSVARYNPPFTPPFMLRNEIWVEIKG